MSFFQSFSSFYMLSIMILYLFSNFCDRYRSVAGFFAFSASCFKRSILSFSFWSCLAAIFCFLILWRSYNATEMGAPLWSVMLATTAELSSSLTCYSTFGSAFFDSRSWTGSLILLSHIRLLALRDLGCWIALSFASLILFSCRNFLTALYFSISSIYS